ncbi:MAG: SGNH/GDSL hydrolase family protein [Chthoniobacterales bacterium]
MKPVFRFPFRRAALRGLFLATFLAVGATFSFFPAEAQTPPVFSKMIVFGDSLSDTGNVRKRMEDTFLLSYPGGDFNYSDGRFTNSSDTDPGSPVYVGVWYEQLARTFLNLPVPGPSLNGGSNYSFGGGTTENGTKEITVIDNPAPFTGGNFTVTIDNMGRQMDDYFNQQVIDPAALYVVWGGGNDLFNDDSVANVVATSQRVVALVNRLVNGGAKHILVPNVPALGGIPNYRDNPSRQVSLNRASAEYRRRLNEDLDAYSLTLPTVNPPVIYRLDVWSLFLRLAANPASDGFTDISAPARGQSGANPDQFLFWDDIHPTTAAHFVLAREANRVLSGAVQPVARAVNLSTRANVQTGDNVAIGGFIITGPDSKRVVLRGLGPSLTGAGVAGALADPVLELIDGAGTSIVVNDNWQESPEAAEISTLGLAPAQQESAILRTLAPGNFTVVLRGVASGTGVGLVEMYDVAASANSTLANLSTRGAVGVGDGVLIGGIIVGSGDIAITVVRALGPSLTSAGVSNVLADPTLELYNSNGMQIAANDDWRTFQPIALRAVQLTPLDDREAAIVAPLTPGNYTVVVRGKDQTTGVALVEVYRIP